MTVNCSVHARTTGSVQEPEVRPGVREESASPARPAKIYIYLAALFCILFSLSIYPFKYGFQMVAPYSMVDLTRDMYAIFLQFSGTFL